MRIVHCLAVALCLVLAGCAWQGHNTVDSPYQLQGIPAEFVGQTWLHKLVFNHSDTLLAQLEFSESGVKMVALSPSGQVLAQLGWQPGRAIQHYQPPLMTMDWQRVLADIQMIHWPLAMVEKGLNKTLIVRQNTAESGNIRREIYQQGKLIVDIQHQGKGVLMHNYAMGYQLHVEFLN